MGPLFAAAGLAEASDASLFFLLLIAVGPYLAILAIIVFGSIIAFSYEMPPEDYGEARTTKPSNLWDDEV